MGLLLSGCGNDTPPAPPPTPAAAVPAAANLKPCDLLTPADVTRVIGQEVLAPQAEGFECSFSRRAEGGLTTRAVRLRVEEGDASPYDMFESYKTTIRTALGTSYDPERVLGVGAVAGWDGDALIAAAAAGPSRSAFLIVQLDGVPPENERAFAEALAQQALSRLRTLRP
jgi:hypothetical protein